MMKVNPKSDYCQCRGSELATTLSSAKLHHFKFHHMCSIKILGPKSQKYRELKERILNLVELSSEEILVIESNDLNDIVEADISSVPTAIFYGPREFRWTEQTPIEMMIREMNMRHSTGATCPGTCKMKKIDPNYSCST